MSVIKMSEATSLALHALSYLARHNDKPARVREMAKILGASTNHLHKVMRQLVRERLVTSERGPKGGFLLARKPDQISLLAVYAAMEGPLMDGNCPLDRSACPFRGKCVFCGLFSELTEKFKNYFKNNTIAQYAQ